MIDLGTDELSIPAMVKHNALHLRTGIAEAELPDGRKVEVAAAVPGSVVVSVRDGDDNWTVYEFSAQALIEAVLWYHDDADNKAAREATISSFTNPDDRGA